MKDQQSKQLESAEKSHVYSYPGQKLPRPEEESAPVEEEPEKTKKRLDKYQKHDKELERILKKDQQMKRIFFIRNIVIIIGSIILIVSLLISFYNYYILINQPEPLEESGYELLKDLQDSKDLEADTNVGIYTWDANKFLKLTSENITTNIFSDEPGFEYLIEVHDLSDYRTKYNRTLDNGLAWSSVDISSLGYEPPENGFSISGLINILESIYEVHLARVTVTVWT